MLDCGEWKSVGVVMGRRCEGGRGDHIAPSSAPTLGLY